MPRLPHRGAGLLALLLIAAIFGAAPAHAQDDVTLATLRVQIWPEYDQPSALVIVDGRTTENVATPIDLRIPLPPGVTLHAVAYPDSATGNLLNAQYEASEDGVTLTSPNGQFLLEYYDGSLAFDGNTRRYTLAFEVPYDVEQFVWEVQQPAGASGLTLDTGATVQRTTGAMGLLVQRVVVGAASAGETVTISFSYTKPDRTLSIDRLNPGGDVSSPQVEGDGPPTTLIALLFAGGLTLIAAGVYWYVKQTRRPQRRRPGGRTRPASSRKKNAAPGGRRFCTSCGEAARPGDKFCRSCGKRL